MRWHIPKIVQVNRFGKQLCRIGIQVPREVAEESGSAGAEETSLRTNSVHRTPGWASIVLPSLLRLLTAMSVGTGVGYIVRL